jgi:hypothetical protein
MSQVYLVTYELEGGADPAEYLPAFSRELRRFPAWWHYLKNTWLVSTEKDADSIYEQLEPHIDDNVNMLVILVADDYRGWLPSEAWEWIEENLG